MAGTILAVAVGSTLAQEAYLARVGPPPLRFLMPRAALPSITLFADPRPKAVAAGSNEVVSVQAQAATPSKGEQEAFVGLSLPATAPNPADDKSSTLSVNSGGQALAPSEIKLAGASAPEPVTAQMMVRFFRTPPPSLTSGAPGTTGGPKPSEGPSLSGTETAVFFPIQFQPPEPLGTRSTGSSASYEVTPKSSEVLEAGQREPKQSATHP